MSGSLLSLSRVGEFFEWASDLGYRREPTRGSGELFRLRRGIEDAVVFRRQGEHATSGAKGLGLVERWRREQ